MTSQLNVDTIVDKAGSGGTNIKVGNDATYVAEGGAATSTNLVQGLAKHWIFFSMADTVNDSFNTSSITDSATGRFFVNTTTAFDNVNYTIVPSSNCYVGNSWYGNQSVNAKHNWLGTNTTTQYDTASYGDSNYRDATYYYCVGHGDLG